MQCFVKSEHQDLKKNVSNKIVITIEGLANDLNEMLRRILNDRCFLGLKETT